MKPELFSIIMYPTVSLNTEEKLGCIMDLLESNEKFTPTYWGNDERVKLKYNRDEIFEKVISEKRVSELYFYRDKSVKYSGRFNVNWSHRSFLKFDFHKTMSSKMWPAFFELSNQLAEIVKPCFGITHIFWPSSYPWNTEQERLQMWMNRCSYPVPVKFLPNGPLGIGTRTYMGSHVLEMFGKDFLLKSPGVVSELNWGGICLDILEKPFEASAESLLNNWVNIMGYLDSAQTIAIPSFDEDRMGVSFTPNQAWIKYLDS
ncbi:hypothetical protein [Lysinibacillus xylanilyticus]|uniref:hypothetical protein n=1 Tax=Lysinibacillus xylanilyticus TaxID=582475 RepID=UPI003D95DE0A